MQVIILVATLLASSLAAPPNQLHSANGRIAGSIAAVNLEMFPYHVALRTNGNWLGCSGSIIGSRWIATAASCTNGLAGLELSIGAGTTGAATGGQEIPVVNVNQHPDFNSETYENDIAILELADDLEFSSVVQSLNLPQQDQPVPVGAQANITGWGRTFEGGNYPAVLLTTFVYTSSQDGCREVLGEAVTDNMLCTDYIEGSRGACEGDEGGPLVINNELIGIISWRVVCGDPGIPEVYTRVAAFRQYIAEVTGF